MIMENSWNYFDIFLLIPLLIAAYRGYSKGFVVEIASLIALFIGVYGALRFSDKVAHFLYINLGWESEYMAFISFAITFILLVIVIHFLAGMLDRLINAVALGFINRLAGSVFRIFKIAFILSIILFAINTVDKQESVITAQLKNNSLLYNPVSSIAPAIFPFLNLELIKKKTDELLPEQTPNPSTEV